VNRVPEIEPASIDDLPAAAALMNVVYDDGMNSVAAWRHRISTEPERAHRRMFKATAAGEVVGWATALFDTHTTTPGVTFVGSTVHPDHRGRGLGAALLAAGEEHVLAHGATLLRSWSRDEEPARRLATRFGYRHTFTTRISRLLLATLPPAPEPPAGVELRSFDEVGPEAVHHVDAIASRDIPEDVPWDDLQFEPWLAEFWESPTLDRGASVAAVVAGEVVAITYLRIDRETGRAENDLTGTLPHARGRGLAKLVKHHSLRRAAELGIAEVFTVNDETNAAMLAVNTALGYRPHSAQLAWLREVG
jgi:mycothiol synthase